MSSSLDDLRDRITVVLVEPRYAGNVGFVARVMMNFGVTRLALVNPVTMTDEGRDRAVHAQKVLADAAVYSDFRECYAQFDYIVALSARVSDSDRSHLRNPVALVDAVSLLRGVEGRIALVFGREDDGLRNDEVEPADVILQIPTHEMYRSMNLSHAVAVTLYETFRDPDAVERFKPATHAEKEVLYQYYSALVAALEMPFHRQMNTIQALRRVLGRGGLSRWEFHRLMGIASKSLKMLGRWPAAELPAEPVDREGDADADAEKE